MPQNASPLKSLRDVFFSLPSPRAARGTRFPLGGIFSLALIATLSGCKNPSQIAAFAKVRPKLLRKLGFRPPKYPRMRESRGKVRPPSDDSIKRLLASVSSEDLNEALAQFLARMVRRGDQAAIDGKALRGAKDYVLSVFVNDICQVVWQEDVGEKENELSCLERSIEAILSRYPNIRLLTGDAAFCHKTIARSAIQARRDYFLQLKAPHTTDVGLAEEAFKQLRCQPPLDETVEKRGDQKGRKS
jgi:hypothetical protein